MHPKHVGPVDNNLQYMKFPNDAHFLDMMVLWDPPFLIYNNSAYIYNFINDITININTVSINIKLYC